MGHSQKAPAGYQPTGQGQADAGYQQLVSNATPWATALPGQIIPGAQNVVNNVTNNPYWQTAQTGANDVASLASGTVAPAMMGAAQTLYGTGMGSLGNAQAGYDTLRGSGDASYANGQQLAGSAMGMFDGATRPGMEHAEQAWQTATGAIPGVTGGSAEAAQMLANGFDPQGALYDREYQKQQDQMNAINAMYGVSGSAYGAGLAGDSSRNFNIDWQNSQLARQLSALGGYDSHNNSVTGNMTSLLNTGGNQYNSLMSGAASRGQQLIDTASTAMNRGVDNQRLNYGTGADIYNSMNAGGINALGAASAHGADALNTLYTSTQLPSSTYLGQQQSQMTALMQMAQAAGMSLSPTGQLIDAQGNYLNIGQGATRNAQSAAQINNAAAAASMSGLTGIAGLGLAAATGGTSLFASGAGMGAGMGAIVSDRRLKRDIVKISERKDGIGVYSFRYKGERERRVGVMAQEVRKVIPHAVVTMANGYMAVDYGAL